MSGWLIAYIWLSPAAMMFCFFLEWHPRTQDFVTALTGWSERLNSLRWSLPEVFTASALAAGLFCFTFLSGHPKVSDDDKLCVRLMFVAAGASLSMQAVGRFLLR
jgi:hypothetical protein